MFTLTQDLMDQIMSVVNDEIPQEMATLHAESQVLEAKIVLYRQVLTDARMGLPLEGEAPTALIIELFGSIEAFYDYIVRTHNEDVDLDFFALRLREKVDEIHDGPLRVAFLRGVYVHGLEDSLKRMLGVTLDADASQALIENLAGFVIQVMAPARWEPKASCVQTPAYDLLEVSPRREVAKLAVRVSERFEDVVTRP